MDSPLIHHKGEILPTKLLLIYIMLIFFRKKYKNVIVENILEFFINN